MGLNQMHRGQFGERLETFAPHFRELCLHFFRFARPLSDSLPDMEAHWCNFNFYGPASKGIAWHRDGDETMVPPAPPPPQGEITGQGRPRSPKTVQSAEGGEGKNHCGC